jgi:putative ABC transport system ATP-binding protein
VYENIELPLTYRQRMSAPDRKKCVMEALERVRMAHRFGAIPHNSRAASSKPSILLADEPTGNLDPRDGEAVMELRLGIP